MINIHHASCLDWLAEYDGPLFDSCVTDPPYHLTSIVKRFGKGNAAPCKEGATGAYARASRGFMGKEWDGGDIAFRPETWRAVYDKLKPGAHLVAFSGTRTYHRMACAIEDAGFEIRDQLFWHYGSGFPKSHDVSKGIDKAAGVEFTASPASGVGFMGPDGPGGYNVTKNQLSRAGQSTLEAEQWQGWGTALKPSTEPICLARKPLGTGDINVKQNIEREIRKRGYFGGITWAKECAESADVPKNLKGNSKTLSSAATSAANAGELPTTIIEKPTSKNLDKSAAIGMPEADKSTSTPLSADTTNCEAKYLSTTASNVPAVESKSQTSSLSITSTGEAISTEKPPTDGSIQTSKSVASQKDSEHFAGIATGLSEFMEAVHINRQGNTFFWPEKLPEFVHSKPITVAANVLKWGTGAINIDGCRVAIGPEGLTKGGCKDKGGRKGFGFKDMGETPQHEQGRWPANLLHDGSDEVLAGFPETSSGGGNGNRSECANIAMAGKNYARITTDSQPSSEGSAARFFYSAKAGPLDRIGSAHPTVKPVDLMRWLCRLITPQGGLILEPFAGSGTTGIAAMAEGFDCQMIDIEAEHVADIERKLAYLRGEGASRFTEHNHAKAKRTTLEPLGGLFGTAA